jgi:hypothetical protein
VRPRRLWAWSSGPSTSPLGVALARSTINACLALIALLGAATHSVDTQAAALTSCAGLEGKTVTLRGTLSTVIDNAPPMDHPDPSVMDPSQRIFVLLLNEPLCSNDPNSTDRVVTEVKVRTVEVLTTDDLARSSLEPRVGQVIRIRGTLSKNPWWRYRASMLLTATKIG